MFEFKIEIKRDYSSVTLPSGMTHDAGILLRHAVDDFGFNIPFNETLTNIQFADFITTNYNNEKSTELSKDLKRMTGLTMVIFGDTTRSIDKVEYKYSVIGCDLDDAEALIDEINKNEINKEKYADNKERRMSVFTSEGGELKSGIFQNENKNLTKKNKNKI